MVTTGSSVVAGADRHDGEVPAGRPVAVPEVLADVAHQHAHFHAIAAGCAERVVARHPEHVPQAPALVLETEVTVRKSDQTLPDGARDRDGDTETRLAERCRRRRRGCRPRSPGRGCRRRGRDRMRCGVAGLGHGRVPCWRGRDAITLRAGQSRPRALKLTEPVGVTMMWSSSVTSMVFSASLMHCVMSMSAVDGVGSEVG